MCVFSCRIVELGAAIIKSQNLSDPTDFPCRIEGQKAKIPQIQVILCVELTLCLNSQAHHMCDFL